MALEERLQAFMEAARAVLGGDVLGAEEMESVRARAGVREDEIWLNPELADVQLRVVRAHGRVGVASAAAGSLREVLGDVGLPGGLAVFRIALQSSAPQEHLRAVWVSVEGKCHAVSMGALDALAGVLDERPASSRVGNEALQAWYERAKGMVRTQALELAEEARRKLVTLQSRRAREVQSVYDVRLKEMAEAGEAGEAVSVQELIQEQRRAQEHVSDHFDPDRLRIRIEPLLAVWVFPQPRKRRSKGAE